MSIGNNPIITIDYLPADFVNACNINTQLLERKKQSNRQSIIQALNKTGWNKAKAARLLGISRMTIYHKMKEYDINEDRDV